MVTSLYVYPSWLHLCSFCFLAKYSNSWIWNDIGRNCLLGHRKNSQIFNEDFHLPLYLPLWKEPKQEKCRPNILTFSLGAVAASLRAASQTFGPSMEMRWASKKWYYRGGFRIGAVTHRSFLFFRSRDWFIVYKKTTLLASQRFFNLDQLVTHNPILIVLVSFWYALACT